MCGILGMIGETSEGRWAQTYTILNSLFLLSAAQRGLDASGFVARTSPFKNCLAADTVTDKAAMPAPDFIASNRAWRSLRHRRCVSVLAHVRWATTGRADDRNNAHPFKARASDVYLVHNGILTDHLTTAQSCGVSLETDCDSEILIRLVEQADHPAVGLDRALRRVKGSAAVAVFDGKRDGTLYLARTDRPLWLARLRNDRRWFFSSTREILLAAFKEVLGEDAISGLETLLPVAAGHVHVLTTSGRLSGLPGDR